MSAIELLEKLGADSQFSKGMLNTTQLNEIIKLDSSDDEVVPPPLSHEMPEDDEDEDNQH